MFFFYHQKLFYTCRLCANTTTIIQPTHIRRRESLVKSSNILLRKGVKIGPNKVGDPCKRHSRVSKEAWIGPAELEPRQGLELEKENKHPPPLIFKKKSKSKHFVAYSRLD